MVRGTHTYPDEVRHVSDLNPIFSFPLKGEGGSKLKPTC